ncbi:MAG: hypothetical protein JJU00_06870 [Opitutales bacterium]|nr:hypothetical protein [Opitutales bacterium]
MRRNAISVADAWNPFASSRGAGDNDATIAAVVFTLLLHMLLYYAVPQSVAYAEAASSDPQRSLEFLLVDPEEERDERYVMAAPDREQQRPEETMNISDRDQMAAQEESAPLSPDNTPLVDGDEEDSNRIIQGNPFEQPSPQPSFGGGEASDTADSPMEERRAAPRETGSAAEIEAPEAESVEPEDPEGARVVEQRGDSSREAELEVPDSVAESAAQERSPLDGDGRDRLDTPAQEASESPVPRPRQTVERATSYGPLRSSQTGAIRIGRLALDAQYSEFGEYWTRVAEIIERRWRNILYNSRSVAFRGARVTVKFEITREGEVENVEILFSDAGRLAETISTDAITSEAPYFRWTPEMILRMGDRSSFRVTFIY